MNKFAKYVPEEDKKKQREHIGAVGVSDLFVNNKEYVLFDETNIELSSGIPWEGKAHGIPRDDKKYCLICNGIEYDLGSPMKQEGQYGRPMMVFDQPEDCPVEVGFMFVDDYESTAQVRPVITCYANENGVYALKIFEPTNTAEPVFENLVEYDYNYYNDEFRGIHGADNVTHFCADRMIGGFIYIPLENIPKPDELIGALIFENVAEYIGDYERGIHSVITADMLDLAPTWSLAPGVKYNICSTDGPFILSVCEGADTWFGPGLYITHHYSGIAWGEQTQVKTIDPKYLPNGVSEKFIINFAFAGDDILTMDKTWGDIVEAWKNNMSIEGVLTLDGHFEILHCTSFGDDGISLSGISGAQRDAVYGTYIFVANDLETGEISISKEFFTIVSKEAID